MIKFKEHSTFDEDKRIFRRESGIKRLPPEYKTVIESLGCVEEVKERIKAGWPPNKVADFIVNERTEDFIKLATTKERLSEFVSSYRKSMSAGELISLKMPGVMEEAKTKLKHGVNTLEELQDLYTVQKDRIYLDYRTEKKLGKLFKTTGNEIAIAATLLKDYAFLKAELGLSDDDSVKFGEVKERLIKDFGLKYGKESVARILSDPRSVSKILRVTEGLFGSLKSDEAVELLNEVIEEDDKNEVVTNKNGIE